MAAYNFTVNGSPQSIEIDDPNTALLYILKENLQLNGPKFGCGLGQCGSCTVLMNGQPIRSCITPVSSVVGTNIVSIEGLGTPANPHPIQQAFITEQAMHCGYCLSGPMLYGLAFINANPNATEQQILQALSFSGQWRIALPLPLTHSYAQGAGALRGRSRMKLRNSIENFDSSNMTPAALDALEKAGASRRDFLKKPA